MSFSRREFIRGGVSAFTFSFAAPAFLSDLARAQGSARRNLVVLYLSGGNDALSMVIPYTDAEYYARRPVLAIPAANVLQIGSDRAGNAGAEAQYARQTATQIASHIPVDMPHLAFVNGTAQQAFATLDRVSAVGMYRPTVAYPNNGLGQALQAVAGAMVNGIGTRVFFVQTGGFDHHAPRETHTAGGAPPRPAW